MSTILSTRKLSRVQAVNNSICRCHWNYDVKKKTKSRGLSKSTMLFNSLQLLCIPCSSLFLLVRLNIDTETETQHTFACGSLLYQLLSIRWHHSHCKWNNWCECFVCVLYTLLFVWNRRTTEINLGEPDIQQLCGIWLSLYHNTSIILTC